MRLKRRRKNLATQSHNSKSLTKAKQKKLRKRKIQRKRKNQKRKKGQPISLKMLLASLPSKKKKRNQAKISLKLEKHFQKKNRKSKLYRKSQERTRLEAYQLEKGSQEWAQ